VSVGLFGLMSAAAIGDSQSYNERVRTGIDIKELGAGLFESWAVPFEVASILLLVALIGAIVIGRTEPAQDGEGGAE
jgi:NADH-quinone oxidoreductase subunit J